MGTKRNLILTVSVRTLLSFVLAVFVLSACSNKTQEAFQQIEAVMQDAPEEALNLLEQIDSTSLSLEDKAAYNLYYAQAEDKSMKDPIRESYVKDAFQYYADKPDHKNYALSQYYMGKLYIAQNKNYEGENCFLNATKAALKHKDYYTTYMAEEKLSKSLLGTDAASSLKYARDALKHYDIMKNIPDNEAYLEMNIAMPLLLNDSLEASILHLNKAHVILHSETMLNAANVQKELFQTYLNIYLYAGRYEQAQFYADSLSKCLNLNKTQYILITYSYVLDNKKQEAIHLFEQLLPHANEYQRNAIYHQLLFMQIQENNDAIAAQYLDSLENSHEKLYRQLSDDKTKYFKKELETALQKEKVIQEAHLRDVILVAAFIIVLCIAVFVFYSVHQRTKKRALLAAAKHEMQIQHNQERISLMRKYILEKITIIESMSPYLEGTVKKLTITEEDWAEIALYLNVTYNNIIQRLAEQHPQLSDKDLRFIELICMGFSNAQLANYYGIADTSIKMRAYHIKKSMGITDTHTSLRMYLSACNTAISTFLANEAEVENA